LWPPTADCGKSCEGDTARPLKTPQRLLKGLGSVCQDEDEYRATCAAIGDGAEDEYGRGVVGDLAEAVATAIAACRSP
jgi:hypothetical protein